jgi:tetratricopeptide (TPR) repeat protein
VLDLSPGYGEAWLLLAKLHSDLGALDVALDAIDRAPVIFKNSVKALRLRAALLGRVGDYDAAAAVHEHILSMDSHAPSDLVAYGNLLRTIGRRADAIDAYRQALAIKGEYGEAWWSLTNLKTERITDYDVAAMQSALKMHVSDENLFHLHFALGRALEDRRDHGAAFQHYEEANRIRRMTLPYHRDETEHTVERAKSQILDISVLDASCTGNASTTPIFIIGMPRSGSTLLEQILASHTMIEGTSELPYIPALSHYLSDRANLSAADCDALGREYLRLAHRHRKTERSFFIDKQPNNWMNIGLIRRILPNAKIIDIRRHPLASAFANFRQHFAQGQAFSYDLADMGHYYALYAGLIDHFDNVFPNALHRIHYEDLVSNLEAQIRRLLAYLELPFEEACLAFYRNDRAVRTPSSEQVRQPIYHAGLQEWRNYEPWLGPAKEMLGNLVTRYPTG